MGLQLSSTKRKKPFLSSQQTHKEKQLFSSSPSFNESFLSKNRIDSGSSCSDSTTCSGSSDSCELILEEEEEERVDCSTTSTHHPILVSSSKNATNNTATTRHKLQQKVKTKSEHHGKIPNTCILHIKVATKTTHNNKNKKNSPSYYFGRIIGPTTTTTRIPLTTGHYTNIRHKPSSLPFEHLAKHNLYYNQNAFSCPTRSSHYMGRHVRHVHSSTTAAAAAAVVAPRTGGRHQSFGKRKPSNTAAAAAAAAAAVAAAAATQKTVVTATAGNDSVPRSVFYGGEESHRFVRTESHFTSYSFCRWFEASSSGNYSSHGGSLYPLDNAHYGARKHVKDVYCPLDTLEMLNKLAHWFLFPIANDIDLDTECTYNRYLGGSDSGRGSGGEIDLFQGLTSFVSSIVRKVFQVDFSQSVGTTFQDSTLVQPSTNHKEEEVEVKGGANKDGKVTTVQASHQQLQQQQQQLHDDNDATSNPQMELAHTLFHSISSIDSEEARLSSSGTSTNTQQQRYLDIECILRLPTMIYDEEGSSSDGFVGSIDTYDTDGGKSIKMEDHEDTAAAAAIAAVPVDDDDDDDDRNVPSSQHVSNHHHNAISLEWSWITVPRQEDPSQSIHSIASFEETAHDTIPSPLENNNNNNNNNKEDDQCVICLLKFQKGDRLCILPCHHSVHTTCIDKWLCSCTGCGSFSHHECKNASCPMCKSPLGGVDNDPINPFNRGGNDCLHSIKSMASEEESSLVDHPSLDDDSMKSMNLDGLVPSWAFERLGSKIAK
jgi:hypothetical protein